MTYLEKLKAASPHALDAFTPDEVSKCLIGCPYSHGLEDHPNCPPADELDFIKYNQLCVACWNREYQEEKKAEPELTINLKEEKKMKNLRNLIVSKVEDVIASGRIDECVEEVVNCMNLDSEIDDLIQTEIENTIEDYVGPILSETVRDAVREALDNLFD